MKKTKHGSEERGVTFQMIITYRKRLLMELQIKKLIYFILMRDSSEEPCVPLTKTNKLRGLRGGGVLWTLWKAPWEDLVSDPEDLFMEPKE